MAKKPKSEGAGNETVAHSDMTAVITGKNLERLIKAVGVVHDADMPLEFSKDSIRSLAVDAGHFCIVDAKLSMQEPDCSLGECIHSVDYGKLLALAKYAGDEVIDVKAYSSSSMDISIGKHTTKLEYITEDGTPKKPVLKPSVSFGITRSELLDALKLLIDLGNEHAVIKATANGVSFITDASTHKLETDKLEGIAKSAFDLSWLAKMVKESGGCITVSFAEDAPITLKSEEGSFGLEYILAPRVEDA